ncbi:transcription initiation factor TFIID subunit 1-like isoform X2 [Pistacia vera]|uniref:transcription initiation factor TFIID subunit 1-like isoform X2 n=1 Tax=Pistacia vera TaxID=55513 RepID=UPI001263596C|nr:transcription initiation factor TFIID subunit 1-like isoform X2 [Pistacia vera]
MGGYESGSGSKDGRDEDEEEEYEDVSGGNRLLGFMFGNVDNSGDLDVDYLDEDAKEHLAALADKLGSSLTDIDLSVGSPQAPVDPADQDYDEKAEDAIDYEDIDEQYDGPETQVVTEEDHLLPKKEYFSAEVSLATLKPTTSLFDDENYDEDDEVENEQEVVDKETEVSTISLSGEQDECVKAVPEGEKSPEDDLQVGSLGTEEDMVVGVEDHYEDDVVDILEGPLDGQGSAPLPVLCVEDGMVILRFSEIFGIHKPLKKQEKREQRYSFHKDKYSALDISDLVEEDEETYLKGSSQVVSFIKQAHAVQHDNSSHDNDDSESVKFGFVQDATPMSGQLYDQRKDSCFSAEPMKKDLKSNLSAGWQSMLSPNIFPLDQHNWEEDILWDNSPAASENSFESCDVTGTDSETSLNGELELEPRQHNLHSECSMKDEEDHSIRLHNYHVLLESFGSRNSSDHTNNGFTESKRHPQLLRLESRLYQDNINHGDRRRENVPPELCQTGAVKRFCELSLQNRDMMDGSWLNNIMWDPQDAIGKPKLILDLQDEQMRFEILDYKDNNDLQLHAGAMIVTRSVKSSSLDSFELAGHKYQRDWKFNIANDKFYLNGKISQQLQTNSNKRIPHGIRVHHSAPALKLQTMKLKLSNKDISNFHRPKALWYPHDNEVAVKEQGKLPTHGPMKIIIKSLGGKGSKLHVDTEETVASIKAKASKKLDFKPAETVKLFYLGKELEDHKSLGDENVRPNSLLHLVRTKVHLLPRAQKLPGENKSLRPPGAFKKKSDLSVKDGHVFLMEYCEERPLLLSNAGMGANLCTYYQKSAPGDQAGTLLCKGNNSLGNVLTLEPGDKSPFLGDIKARCSQCSLETNMYRAPVFPHKVPSTDFLLVRSAKGKISIRRIDKIAVVGQQEPLMEVMSPLSKNLQSYSINRLLVYVYREFSAAAKRGLLPCIGVDELLAQFPNVSEAIIRKKIKECAFLRRDGRGKQVWSMKRTFQIPPEGDLRKLVCPEHVCSYESMLAGLYRLKHSGITQLTLPASISSAMSQLPDEAIALAAASHIERELLITPWNLSSNFVACTNQDRESIERLEITGVGDPSGRGLGFSYVRAAPKAPMSSSMVKKKAAASRGGTTVTGTDADLRRLSMEAAREVLLKFNVPEEMIAKQTRWHRIAMIRKLSSEQAASGVQVDPTTISKYARGQRMSFLQLQQQTRGKCQEIWDRQVQSLSAGDDDDNGSDSEANSDLDSFAGDLENLLDAEEFEEEGEENNYESKHDKADGVKGLKMRRRPSQAQAEEEIEDEAAEAAELCRLLMDDDEADQKKKKKKTKAVAEEAGVAPVTKSISGLEMAERVKKPNKITKHMISTVQPNGSSTANENIRDPKEEESLIMKRTMSGKMKTMKKNGISPMGQLKKLKILGDNVKMFKEKKSSRESFVCGACGQFGHMRTNKNCPKYRADPDTQLETADSEKASAKPNSLDPKSQSQPKILKKKLISKSATKIAVVEASEDEKSSSKAKVVPVKFKCGSTDKPSDKRAFAPVQSSDQPVISDVGTANKSVAKVNRIKISNKLKPEEMQAEIQKPSIVIRPPADTERVQVESHKPFIVIRPPTNIDREQDSHKSSIVIRPPTNTDREQVQSHRPSIVIRPPTEKDRELPQKKIVIKQPKEIIDLDQINRDRATHFEYRKTKKIVELSSFEKHGKQESSQLTHGSSKKKGKEERRWWEEEEKRRNAARLREERAKRLYEEEMRVQEERERFAEIKRYEESIRREREEEERQKAKKKKKKKKKPEIGDDYLEDCRARRNDRRMPERDCSAKRRPVSELGKYGADSGPPTKRRRAGEVGLSNILERIVETLRENTEVSFLFLKPVSKKEASDYLDIVERPMDLSTIRDKVRRMEYKHHEEFRHDVWQIAMNAHLYNDGRNPGIPPLADQLLELCDFLLDEYGTNLAEAESGIESRNF